MKKMYKVCLWDDDEEFRGSLKSKLCKIGERHHIKMEIIEFSSGTGMLFDLDGVSEGIDIFFVDVLMPGLTGIEAAQKLREWGTGAQIVFFTSIKEHVFQAFDVMPLHYLIKDEATEETIEKILLRAIDLAQKNQRESFQYKVGHTVKRIELQEIIYFEIRNRVVHMFCRGDRQEEFYLTMDKLEKSLRDKNFIRVHRSYLVNFMHIHSIEAKQIVCMNHICIPVGEKYLEQIRKEYSRFILEQM